MEFFHIHMAKDGKLVVTEWLLLMANVVNEYAMYPVIYKNVSPLNYLPIKYGYLYLIKPPRHFEYILIKIRIKSYYSIKGGGRRKNLREVCISTVGNRSGVYKFFPKEAA